MLRFFFVQWYEKCITKHYTNKLFFVIKLPILEIRLIHFKILVITVVLFSFETAPSIIFF
jgi:hypothetical protein